MLYSRSRGRCDGDAHLSPGGMVLSHPPHDLPPLMAPAALNRTTLQHNRGNTICEQLQDGSALPSPPPHALSLACRDRFRKITSPILYNRASRGLRENSADDASSDWGEWNTWLRYSLGLEGVGVVGARGALASTLSRLRLEPSDVCHNNLSRGWNRRPKRRDSRVRRFREAHTGSFLNFSGGCWLVVTAASFYSSSDWRWKHEKYRIDYGTFSSIQQSFWHFFGRGLSIDINTVFSSCKTRISKHASATIKMHATHVGLQQFEFDSAHVSPIGS